MLLEQLRDYATNRMEMPPTLYVNAPVRYIVYLDSDGRYLDMADTSDMKNKRGKPMPVPQVQRTVAIKPLLLADKADYTLGYVGEEAKPERVKASHAAYMELLERCAASGEPAVQAVLTFLRNDPLGQITLPDKFDPGGMISFNVRISKDEWVYPPSLKSVQDFWAAENDVATKGAKVMQCLVCGQQRPVLDRLQGKLKGVPGGQMSGTSMISANAAAFESYGLEASLIAPICADCAERFTKAANALLSNAAGKSRYTLGGAAFIYWTREESDFDPMTIITEAKPDDVDALFRSLGSGNRSPTLDDTAFYATTLSGSGGRTVVRDWIDTTLGAVRVRLAEWFQLQRIAEKGSDDMKPFGLYALASSTVRDANKDLAPPTPRALLHAALTGSPLPFDLLYQAVRRNRAEQRVTRPRAALIKMVLLSNGIITPPTDKEDYMIHLEKDNPNAAYLCGRLLAVLERAQDLAIPNLNAGLVNRYYGTASSAPASVFPRLIRGLQSHMNKLERDNKGAYYNIKGELEEILAGLSEFPTVLPLKEQGMFALGYYHQSAASSAQARERSAQKKAQAGGTNTDAIDK